MVDGVTARNRTDNCCPCKYRETRLTRKGSDERAYRGPKNTQGGSSFCGVGLPPGAAITLNIDLFRLTSHWRLRG